MDERLEKAFQTANFMATLSNQKRAAFEEFNQKLIYYINGSSFIINKELISFVKTLLEFDYKNNVVLIDNNQIPVVIENLEDFLKNIVKQYYESCVDYQVSYSKIKSKRKAEDLINL